MNFKLDVQKFVQNYLDKHNARYNRTCKIYDPPVWNYIIDSKLTFYAREEDIPEMIFIYFTSREDRLMKDHKWYHMLVISSLGIEIYYENQDMISINRNYSLSDVKLWFTNRCKHMLSKMDVVKAN